MDISEVGVPSERKYQNLISRYHKKSIISLNEAEQSIKKKIFWLIPNDYSTTMSAINQGKTLSSVAQGAEITKSFREMASVFLGKGAKQEVQSKFWGEFSDKAGERQVANEQTHSDKK